MDEIKVFMRKSSSMSNEEYIKNILDILKLVKKVGFINVVKEIPELNNFIKTRLKLLEIDDAINLIKNYLPFLFDAIKEYIESTERIQNKVREIDDLSIDMKLNDDDFEFSIIIKSGKLYYKMETQNSDLKLRMNKNTMKLFMSDEMSPLKAAYKGDLTVEEGNIRNLLKLHKFLTTIQEDFGIDILGL